MTGAAADLEAELASLRAQNGMRLGAWKPYMEVRYGGDVWSKAYAAVTTALAGPLREAGLAAPCADVGHEIRRMRQVLRYEDAACAWMERFCRDLDAKIDAIRSKGSR